MKIMNLNGNNYNFLASQEKENLIQWLTKQFANNEKAVVEITAEKYSGIVGSLCVQAIGKENVIGVVFTENDDMINKDCTELLRELNLNHIIRVPLTLTDKLFTSYLKGEELQRNQELKEKLIKRFKAMFLSSLGDLYGKTIGLDTLSNLVLDKTAMDLSNNYDICPVANFTASEVIAIGKSLNLSDFCLKELRNIDFNYTNLDLIIREGSCNNEEEADYIWEQIQLNKTNRNKNINEYNSFLPNCIY